MPRRGLRLRELAGTSGRMTVWEVNDDPPLEALRSERKLTRRQFDAGVELRRLWRDGALLVESRSSPIARLGLGRSAPYDADDVDDERLEANDRLRRALRAMGMMGMRGRLAVDVVVYDRPVTTADELDALREALGRLADHLAQERLVALLPARQREGRS